jgi:hypothetical protein
MPPSLLQCTATNQQNTIDSSEKIIGLMRDVIENGKSDEALSQIQKQEIKQYILSDQRYFKETFYLPFKHLRAKS